MEYRFEYLTEWFATAIAGHTEVTSVTSLDSGHVLVNRSKYDPVTVAPVTVERINTRIVDAIIAGHIPTVICLVPTDSHYDWEAREKALRSGSSVQTMKEFVTSLSHDDPRPFLNKDVAYARERFSQHSRVRQALMRCEASMELTREGLGNVVIAIDYQYEFSEEALVRALRRHPDANAVLNANPNGTPTRAALDYAKQAGVGLFSSGELMGALNYEGAAFRDYRPRR